MKADENGEALFWLRLAAEQGLCEAQVGLAVIAFSALKDPASAPHWLAEARRGECDKSNPTLAEQMQQLSERLR